MLMCAFMEKNGENYTGPISSLSHVTALGTPFNLKPHQTAQFCLDVSSLNHGYGVIESSADETGQSFLVASGYYQSRHTQDAMTSYMIPVNNACHSNFRLI